MLQIFILSCPSCVIWMEKKDSIFFILTWSCPHLKKIKGMQSSPIKHNFCLSVKMAGICYGCHAVCHVSGLSRLSPRNIVHFGLLQCAPLLLLLLLFLWRGSQLPWWVRQGGAFRTVCLQLENQSSLSLLSLKTLHLQRCGTQQHAWHCYAVNVLNRVDAVNQRNPTALFMTIAWFLVLFYLIFVANKHPSKWSKMWTPSSLINVPCYSNSRLKLPARLARLALPGPV